MKQPANPLSRKIRGKWLVMARRASNARQFIGLGRTSLVIIPLFRSFSRTLSSLAAVFLCLFFFVNPLHAAPLAVTIVLSENAGPYQEFSTTLRENLSRRNVAFVVIDNPAGPIPGSGLVIGVGMKAATAVAASKASVVLNVLIPKPGYEQLLRDFPQRAHSKTFSAIFMDQPMERQVRLIEAVLPGKHRVGVMFDSFSPEELAQLRQRVTRHGLSLREQYVSSNLSLYEALQALLQDSEVLLALPDESVYNNSTLRNILLATYRSGVPLIGFSPGYVKAGALAAVFSTPVQIAEQAVLSIQQYGETRTLPAAQYPQMFEVATNEQVARSLGLSVRSADELRREMRELTGDEP